MFRWFGYAQRRNKEDTMITNVTLLCNSMERRIEAHQGGGGERMWQGTGWQQSQTRLKTYNNPDIHRPIQYRYSTINVKAEIWAEPIGSDVTSLIGELAVYPASLGFPPSLQPSLTASLWYFIMYSMIMYSRSVKFNGITSPSRPPTLCNITLSVTSSNVER